MDPKMKKVNCLLFVLFMASSLHSVANELTDESLDVTGNTYRFSTQYQHLNHREYVFYPQGQVAVLTWYDMSGNSAGNPLLLRGGWKYVNDNKLLIQLEFPGRNYGEQWVYKNITFTINDEGIVPSYVEIINRKGENLAEQVEKTEVLYSLSEPQGATRFKVRYPNKKSFDLDYIAANDMKKKPYKLQGM